MTHIVALLPLLLCSSVQSTHPHPTSAPLTLTTSGEYRNGGNDTNVTIVAAGGDTGNATDATVDGDSNSTTTTASAAAAAEAGAIVGIDTAAIPEYAGSVSFLQRNRRQKQRNLRQKFVQGG